MRPRILFLVAVLLLTSTPSLARPSRRLTHQTGALDYWPRFSPDGKTVLFSRCEVSSDCHGASTTQYWTLWKVPAAGGKAQQFLALDAGISATRSDWLWNPKATSGQIAFTGINQSGTDRLGLWIVDADRSNPTKIPLPASVGGPSYPSWFPDGASVAVTGRVASGSGPHLT